MAHTFDLTTDRGKTRLLLADKRQESAWFTDAEIDNAITVGGSVDGAVNYLLRILALGHAFKGDVERSAALLALLVATGGNMPTLTMRDSEALPTDDAYTFP